MRRPEKASLAIAAAFVFAIVGFAAQPIFAYADTAADSASAATEKSGLVKESGKLRFYNKKGVAITSKWKTVDGAKYYFDADGNAVRGTSKKIDGKYWVFSNAGKLLTPSKARTYSLKKGIFFVKSTGNPLKKGWQVKSGKLYKIAKNGKCTAGKRVDGITFLSKGYAKSTYASKLKIATMKFVKKHTSSSQSKYEKLHTCFNYLVSRNFTYSAEPKDIGYAGWVQRAALGTLSGGTIECITMACAFAACAYELGYEPSVKAQANVHGYVMIDGKAYDNMYPGFGGTEQSQYKSWKPWKFVSWSTLSPKGKATAASKAAEAVEKKNGLVKEGNYYYFYKNGKKVKKQWVKIGKKKYWFKKNGRAAIKSVKINGKYFVFGMKGVLKTGTKTRVVKVDGVKYRVTKSGKAAPSSKFKNGKVCYLKNGELATYVRLVSGKLQAFSKKGVYNSAGSKQLQEAAIEKADASTLLQLLTQLDSSPAREQATSCMMWVNPATGETMEGGDDVLYTYKHIKVQTYLATDGIEYFIMIS